MYERSRVNTKVERGSTSTSTHDLSYIASILFTHVNTLHVNKTDWVGVEIALRSCFGRC